MRKALIITLIALAVIPTGRASNTSRTYLNIPRLQLKTAVSLNLNTGPAFWPETGRPGSGDTIAIAGHRTTHTKPFHDLDKLRNGDRIYLRYGGHTHAYVMTSRQIVSVKNLHIADGLGYERLLLTACAKRDGTPTSASWRIVVYALPYKMGSG